MTLSISTAQSIVATEVGLLLITILLSFVARSRSIGQAFAWINTVLAVAVVGVTAYQTTRPATTVLDVSPAQYYMYAAIGIIVAGLTWGAVRIIATMLANKQRSYLESPQTVSRLSDELRDVLRSEGIELDSRLQQAEVDREQFLYALEERHARQIAGLAQEYQHEAQTILRQLLDQLAAEQLEPMVEQRLAEQREAIERELGAINTAVAGEALTTLRADFSELTEKVEAAESRITTLRAENPDTSIEELAEQRLAAVEALIEERMTATRSELDVALAQTVAALDERINDVGALLDAKVETASNPLAQRMAESEHKVEARLAEWTQVLDGRFAETGQILNQRIIEQEQALEQRVVTIEGMLAQRLEEHTVAIESMLAGHDAQLQTSLSQQQEAVGAHFTSERDRLIGELTEHAVAMQEQIAHELADAEIRARETVSATQAAWNHFTEELEDRFAQTREEALRAAQDIATAERETLERSLAEITSQSSGEISQKVEELAREAAWQRSQVERTVAEQVELLQRQAQDAVANADVIFADLDRIGAERVDAIRRQAEDALVQSRDYVGQLQESLGTHLDSLRERSGELADEMNDRLGTITAASQDTAVRLEAYSRELLEATMTQLTQVSEGKVLELQSRLAHELNTSVQSIVSEQQAAYERHLGEVGQRLVQTVQGDLSGIAEHARTAVTGELDMLIAQSRDQAMRAQEQSHLQVMNEIARQQTELGDQARQSSEQARRVIEDGLREGRRQLEEAMASMGAHMREEMVRFRDEGERRIAQLVDSLRVREQEMVREEDRKLTAARQELVRQHEGAMQDQMRQMMSGLSTALGSQTGGNFTTGIDRPATPLNSNQGAAFGATPYGS